MTPPSLPGVIGASRVRSMSDTNGHDPQPQPQVNPFAALGAGRNLQPCPLTWTVKAVGMSGVYKLYAVTVETPVGLISLLLAEPDLRAFEASIHSALSGLVLPN